MDACDRIGEVVAGKYALETVLGSGGQGAVYRARDLRDGDTVAIKVLHSTASKDPVARERLAREMQALVMLWGSGAVRVLDQGFADDGSLCLVMEYLRGLDLEAYCARFEAKGEKISEAATLTIFEPIVATLETAHERGIVHRDLKPGNVFLVYPEHGGGVRVLDFGFAKFTRMKALTAAGTIPGSPSYIAPESWRGAQPDSRIDVYALGVLVFRTLTGRVPFTAHDIPTLMALVMSAPRPSLHALRPDLPKAIDDWAVLALAAQPEGRFQSVRALWNALGAVLDT